MLFRQLFDPTSSTYTYLLGDATTGEAVLIDPVFEQAQRDAALLHELGLKLCWTLETHVHADHVTGAWLLRQALGSRIALSQVSQAQGADRWLSHGDRIAFGDRTLEVRATPGHTNGCLTYVLDNGSCGDAHTLFQSVRQQVFTLPDTCMLYPGHDYNGLTASSVAEERRFNPRLGEQVMEPDFVAYMAHLALPHPRQIDRAVPANLQCGQPHAGLSPAAPPPWARLRLAFSGVWELEPDALQEVLPRVQLVDVREPDEFIGVLGHIDQARSIPLGQLPERLAELDRALPVVVVCRSGARSARAVGILKAAGLAQVAHLAGGMLHWNQVMGDPSPQT